MKAEEIISRIEKVIEFADKEENRNAVSVIFRRLRKILDKSLPKKITGDLTIGFEDPYYTGKALSGMAIFYPLFKDMDITPVFDKEELHGNAIFEGKITLFHVLWNLAFIWFNKDFRRSDIWQKIQK